MATKSIIARDRRRFAPSNLYKKGVASKTQIVAVTDLIAEGPIEGLTNSDTSVFLDGDPIYDPAAEAPFHNSTLSISIGSTAENVNGTIYNGQASDASTNTIGLNTLDITKNNEHRVLYVWGVAEFQAKVTDVVPGSYIWSNNTIGHRSSTLTLEEVVSGANPFQLIHEVTGGRSIANGTHRFRVYKGEEYAEYTLWQVQDANGDEKNDGNGPVGELRRISGTGWGSYGLFTEDDEDAQTEVTVKVDLFLQCIIIDVNGNKVLQVLDNDYTNAYTVSKKQFSISRVMDHEGRSRKVPNSSIQFRRGTEHQSPLIQLAGVGTSSIAVTLADSDKAAYKVIGKHWKSNTTGNNPYLREDFHQSAYTQADFMNYLSAGGSGNTGGNQTNTRITLETKSVTLSSQGMTMGQISEIDELRIQLTYPGGLFHLDGGGNTYWQAAAHQVHVFIKRDGAWLSDEGNVYNSGSIVDYRKEKASFTRDIIVEVGQFQPYEDMKVQITRLTPTGQDNEFNDKYEASSPWKDMKVRLKDDNDNNNTGASDTSQITAIIAIIKEKLNYPFTALASVSFNSKDYQSLPTRMYDVQGKKIQIPSNYVPRHLTQYPEAKTAEYKGLWDGTFCSEGASASANANGLEPGIYYTDNPAWIFYDMLTNDRYGLGGFIKHIDIDKYALYKIAKYCDELVPDGKGGTEPRFTANVYLTKATDCYKVLKDMATVFRGMLYWLDGQLLTVQDSPAAPVYTFGKSNIVNGEIKYEGTGEKTRVNQIIVSWNNPDSGYKIEPVIVEDRQNIIDTGRIIKEDAHAFGCTSQGQAVRYGKWKLWTSINQTEIISFKTGITTGFLTPGDIINIQNIDDYGITFTGRISAYEKINSNSQSKITLDRDISTESGGAQTDEGGVDRGTYSWDADSTYTLSIITTERKIVLAQDTASIYHSGTGSAATTYKRGDTLTHVFLPNASNVFSNTALDINSWDNNTAKRNIVSAQDGASTPSDVLLQLVENTGVETREFNSGDVTVVSGKTVITFDTMSSTQVAAFDNDPVVEEGIWAIKEVTSKGTTDYSYKEYKVLGISEDDEGNFGVTAAEFSTSKFDAVDREFELDTPDTVYTAEDTTAPPPPSVYLLREPKAGNRGDEITVQWERPLASDTTNIEDISGYEIQVLPPFAQPTYTTDSNVTSYALTGIPDGDYVIGVRTVTAENRYSRYTYERINIKDIYGGVQHPRIGGLCIGAKSDSVETEIIGSTFALSSQSWSMLSNSDERSSALTNPSTSTASTYQQSMLPMTYDLSVGTTNTTDGSNHGDVTYTALTTAYIVFDRTPEVSNDYLRLMNYKANHKFENTILDFWYDVEDYAPDTNNGVEANRWTHINCSVSVGYANNRNKVVKTGGDDFTDVFIVGDVIRLKQTVGGTDKYYAAKVAYIQSAKLLFTDRPLNTTSADITVAAGSSDAKNVSRQNYRLDPKTDAIIATITRSNTTYTIQRHLVEDGGLRSRAVTAFMQPNTINYNSEEVQTTTFSSSPYPSLVADAVNFINPVFKVTGDFASNSNGSSDGAGAQDDTWKHGDGGAGTTRYTKVVHNTTNAIAYGNGSTLDFTVAVRESSDTTNTAKEKTTTASMARLREGVQGSSAAIVYLYKGATSVPASPQADSNFPNVTVSMAGGTAGKITSDGSDNQIASTGWYAEPPSPGTGETIYIVAATANSTGATDSIAYGEWTTPAVAWSGASGLDGYNTVWIDLYKATNSTITQSDHSGCPAEDRTWSWTTGSFNALPTGWYYDAQAAYAANSSATGLSSTLRYLYKTTAFAISRDTTYLVDGTDNSDCAWSIPALVAEYTPGPAGLRSGNGYIYYQVAAANNDSSLLGTLTGGAITGAVLNTNAAYSFSSGTMTAGNVIGTGSGKWNTTAPQFAPTDSQKDYWNAYYVVSESSAGSGVGTPVFSAPQKYTSFTGLVRFTATGANAVVSDGAGGTLSFGSSGETLIDGARIQTGIIKSTGTDISTPTGAAFATGSSGTGYSYFNLTNGAIATKGFKVDTSGNAEFKGTIGASSFNAGSTMTGAGKLTVGDTAKIVLQIIGGSDNNKPQLTMIDSSGNTRIKLGYLGTS